MALKSTIYKLALGIADLDRGYYADHGLTLACHPSETEERLMVRVLAFALHADPRLEFGRGISSDDEPALWRRDYAGDIEQWIEVGLPDERLLRRASGRAREVCVLAYGGRAMDIWWSKEGAAIARLPNVAVRALDATASAALGALAQRGMNLHCTIQDGQVLLAHDGGTLSVEPRWLCGQPD